MERESRHAERSRVGDKIDERVAGCLATCNATSLARHSAFSLDASKRLMFAFALLHVRTYNRWDLDINIIGVRHRANGLK